LDLYQRAAGTDAAADPADHARYRSDRLLAADPHRAAQHRQHHLPQPGLQRPRMSEAARRALGLTLAASLTAGVLATAAPAQERFSLRKSSDREFDERIRRADPGKVVAAEIAFARTAQEKGQWTAFAEFAADDAV